MRKIKQVDRPFAVTRTMPHGEALYSVYTTLEAARRGLEKLPKKQLPAWVKVRRAAGWESVCERTAAKASA